MEKGDNGAFWIKKIVRNMERDDNVNKEIRTLGWRVLRFWGDDIKRNLDDCVKTVDEAVFDYKFEDEMIEYTDNSWKDEVDKT